jgi:hypothetical protein
MKYIEVYYKKKFSKEFDGGPYTYKCGNGFTDYQVGDIVAVETCYGLEIARVTKAAKISEHSKGRATRYIHCLVEGVGKVTQKKEERRARYESITASLW